MYRILTSVMGLGTYVPALFLRDSLLQEGKQCEVEIFETYISEEMKTKIINSQKSYHKNFKVAKIGHKLAEKELKNMYNFSIEEKILNKWNINRNDIFIIFSGNWMPLMQRIKIICSNIYAIHMDADFPPSWKQYSQCDWIKNIFVFEKDNINYIFNKKINFNQGVNLPIVYIHGGGWGMGDYQELYEEFYKEMPFKVMTTIHNKLEIRDYRGWDYYLLELDWMFHNEQGQLEYPSMYHVVGDKKIKIANNGHQGMYTLYQSCSAIISKAGGGTLLDSMLMGIPLVFLEPVANHELKNQELWEKLGFGISYYRWKKTGYSMQILIQMQKNILEHRKKIPSIESIF